jgi:prevent-host-death family protein
MPATVKIAELKAHLSEMVARAEAGEEVVITRGHQAVARLMPLEPAQRARAAIEDMLALRDSGRIKPVSQAEIRAWIDEGRA